MSGLKKALLLLGGLTLWYAFTSPSSDQIKNKKEYPLPEEIRVVETSLPYETRERIWTSTHSEGNEEKKVELEKIVKTSEIDFSSEFNIKTDRYNFVKKEEWLPSRIIGHVFSLPTKLYFWDWDAGLGLDEQKSRAVLSMLEENKNISGLTVRVNHNEAIYDCYRLFADEQVTERNNFLARLLLGLPTSIPGELFAEFRRGDYYNSMNQTVVLFSNIESVSGHEIGHHQDYQRFDSDWEYGLAGFLYPVKLYKEWQASQNSKKLLSAEDQWQFNRFLLPAFLTYLIGGFYVSRKLLQRDALKSNRDNRDIDELEEYEKPEIQPIQTLRHFGTMNGELYAGFVAYSAVTSVVPELVGYAIFAAATITTNIVADELLKRVIPYEHE